MTPITELSTRCGECRCKRKGGEVCKIREKELDMYMGMLLCCRHEILCFQYLT